MRVSEEERRGGVGGEGDAGVLRVNFNETGSAVLNLGVCSGKSAPAPRMPASRRGNQQKPVQALEFYFRVCAGRALAPQFSTSQL